MERNCKECIHNTGNGCESWECEFKKKEEK